jgi:glycosyltransferase involved in cell wall biosynthesis
LVYFSIVIPTYNRCALLAATLRSVLQQSFRDYEIIVVDDGSVDGTKEYLKSVGGPITTLYQANRGAGAARNRGAAAAKGRYLAFLDSDDLWFPWTLETYRKIIEEFGAPAFIAGCPYIFGDEQNFGDEQKLSAVLPGGLQVEGFPDYLSSGDEWRWWGASSFVLDREAFEAVGGYTEEWVNGEDGDLALRLGTTPKFVQVLSPMTFGYREHAAGVSRHMERTIADAWCKIKAEKGHCYPGGRPRAHERWRILTRHIRPVTMGCLTAGFNREAWQLYRATFMWNLSLGRVKYLAGFPLLAAKSKTMRVFGPRFPGVTDNSQFRSD